MNKMDTSNFKRLIGVWKTSGKILSGDNTMELSGTDSYEYILDGNFILHEAAVLMGVEKSETFEMISPDHSTSKATLQYFNSKGEAGVMSSEINGNDFLINGQGLKFIGTINTDNTTVIGKWFMQADNNGWKQFIELKLEKQN